MLIEEATKYCMKALKDVSRSFALTIPLVEKNILIPIVVGYLEARIIDNFEDEKVGRSIQKKERIENIDKAINIITNSENSDIQKRIKELGEIAMKSISNPYYLDLALNMDKVIALHNTMNQEAKNVITKWFSEMAEGMKKFINIEIDTFEQLDEYCYYVGGTVGGFVTELIMKNTKKATPWQMKILSRKENDLGLFLQKVNIIRDFRQDMLNNEKIFWPYQIFQEQNIVPVQALDRRNEAKAMIILEKMIVNAKKHIDVVKTEISAIPDDYPGFRNASIINFLMGIETLAKIKDNPDVFYSDIPVKIDKSVKNEILEDPIGRLEEFII